MGLRVIHERVEPGSCRNWNYRIEDIDGNVHYCGTTSDIKGRCRQYNKPKGTQFICHKMHEQGIENFVMVVHDGDNEPSKRNCWEREVDYMHWWRTIISLYPDNPYASNVVSTAGKNNFDDLPKKKQDEIRKKTSDSMRKFYDDNPDHPTGRAIATEKEEWLYDQIYIKGVLIKDAARDLGTSPGSVTRTLDRYAKRVLNKPRPPCQNRATEPFTNTSSEHLDEWVFNEYFVKKRTKMKLAKELKKSIPFIDSCIERHVVRNCINLRNEKYRDRARRFLSDAYQHAITYYSSKVIALAQ